MQLITTLSDLREALRPARRAEAAIGLVPTMGYLHRGHMTLVDRARAENAVTVVSIFVNPTQFGPNEDFAAYPRDLDRDLELCRAHGVDLVFAPDVREMYPQPIETHVEVESLSDLLIGRQRPGHFRGVATVVTKLFNIAEPTRAYFGEKDFQQLAVVRRMVRDLSMRVAIVGVPTVREADGLAMSSRNVRLSAEERQAAPVLHRGLAAAAARFADGERDVERLLATLTATIGAEPSIALVSADLCDSATLRPVERVGPAPAVLLVTARLGAVVLIDQMELVTEEGP
ncbi:pantothenate synthetase [Aureimonas endophytica]|uniref:Pantothenate synthetase n=1 Tax=Aureimonas endophytica TaxID=2027858 RepID=A0A916ZZC8_9HYPH|nr:pantoate--beta-alanine ligase [Aureimonas endophytica]GGE18795.1 pantothenate synthetase [Aureimonas endophytica]